MEGVRSLRESRILLSDIYSKSFKDTNASNVSIMQNKNMLCIIMFSINVSYHLYVSFVYPILYFPSTVPAKSTPYPRIDIHWTGWQWAACKPLQFSVKTCRTDPHSKVVDHLPQISTTICKILRVLSGGQFLNTPGFVVITVVVL